MSNFIDPEMVEAIWERVERGESLRTISAETGADKNTVATYRLFVCEVLREIDVPQPQPKPLPIERDWHCEDCRTRTHGSRCLERCIQAVDERCVKCGGPRSENTTTGKCWKCWKAEQAVIWAESKLKPKVRAQREDYFATHPAIAASEARKIASELIGRPRYRNGEFYNDRLHWTEDDKRILAAFAMAGADIDKSSAALGRSPKGLVWRARDTYVPMPRDWAAIIATARTKSNGTLIQLSYPYIAKPRDEHADMLAINDLVPKTLPSWVRADVCQNILLAVLEGETTVEELRRSKMTAQAFVGRFMKQQRDHMLVSIEGLRDDTRSYEDISATPGYDEARLAIHSYRTHTEATQESDVMASEMHERQKAWHEFRQELSAEEIEDIMGANKVGEVWTPEQEARMHAMTKRHALHERQHGRCGYCQCKMVLRFGFPRSVTRDHIIPTSAGGSDDDSNLIGACYICNARKGSMPVAEFLKTIGRALPSRDVRPGSSWAFREHRSQAHV